MKAILFSAILFISAGFTTSTPAVLKVGEKVPDIALKTTEGETVQLSSLRGKIVLIDFWASWCKPCRNEITNVLLPEYKKYKEQGFEVYGVSIDQHEGMWKKAVEQWGLPWVNVSDLKGWTGTYPTQYNVKAVPASYLIDKDGTLMAVNLRGERLQQKLEEIFNH